MDTNMIKDVIQFIDVMATRGAIRGEELQGVGALRTALKAEMNPPVTKSTPKIDTEALAEQAKMRVKSDKNRVPGS
jgi:uncharacterized protein (DUF4415 family)